MKTEQSLKAEIKDIARFKLGNTRQLSQDSDEVVNAMYNLFKETSKNLDSIVDD